MRSVTVRSLFLQGLAITVPITLTLFIFYSLATTTERFLGGVIQFLFPRGKYWPGMGILLAIALILFAGVLMNIWITRRLLVRIDRVLDRIPLVKSLYGSMRDIAFLLSRKDAGKTSQQVVTVRISEHIYLIGFVTARDVAWASFQSTMADSLVAVYLPMSYQIGGYTVYLPNSLVQPIDMTVEDAMRLTLTAGVSGKRQPYKQNKAGDAGTMRPHGG
jgi:uncharacterized membrane protein